MKSKFYKKSQGPQKHELSKKKRVDGFETLNQQTINQPKPQNQQPPKPISWDPSVFFFLLGGGEGVNLLFLFETKL